MHQIKYHFLIIYIKIVTHKPLHNTSIMLVCSRCDILTLSVMILWFMLNAHHILNKVYTNTYKYLVFFILPVKVTNCKYLCNFEIFLLHWNWNSTLYFMRNEEALNIHAKSLRDEWELKKNEAICKMIFSGKGTENDKRPRIYTHKKNKM